MAVRIKLNPLALRRFREQKGLNRKEFSDQLGVSESSLAHWERGSYKPSRLAMKAIAAIVPSAFDYVESTLVHVSEREVTLARVLLEKIPMGVGAEVELGDRSLGEIRAIYNMAASQIGVALVWTRGGSNIRNGVYYPRTAVFVITEKEALAE